MKNKSKITSKIAITLGVGIPCAIALSIVICISGFVAWFIFMLTVPKMTADNFFNKLEIEATMPSCASYSTVYFDDESVILRQYLTEEKEQELLQVFAIDNGSIYFAYGSWENNECLWNIAKVDADSEQMETLCSYSFSWAQNNVYEIYHGNEYSERNGYYLDGKIVLTDHIKVLEYTIADNSYIVTDYENYQFPNLEIKGEIIDSETIRFETADGEKILKFSEAASNSKALSEIYALKDKKDWNGESYLIDFFSEIEIVGDKVYILCTVYNYSSHAYTVILEYNSEENSCDYAGYYYFDDRYLYAFNIIPD